MIQSGHHNRDEDAAQELLEEVLRAVPVTELEEPEMGTLYQGLRHACEVQSHPFLHLPDNHHQHGYQADGLQRVGPDDGFDATAEGIEPNQQDADHGCQGKGDMPGVEHVGLQNQHHQIEPGGRSHDLG